MAPLVRDYVRGRALSEGRKDFVGIEIEMEGSIRVGDSSPTGWSVKTDGSLRGASAREFVLRTPTSVDKACAKVDSLYNSLKSTGSRIADSMRAGVHVHLNFGENTLRELYTFVAAYYCLEASMSKSFGEDRVGNLFCRRMADASAINENLVRAVSDRSLVAVNDNFKYSALNLAALSRYGSLESRILQTPTTPEAITRWVKTLVTFKRNVLNNFKDPTEVADAISAGGYDNFAEICLGKYAKDFDITEDEVMESVRLIQYWIYTTDWKTYDN